MLTGAGGAAALDSLGAVTGAGVAGYGLGRLLDEGFGGVMSYFAGDNKKDRTLSGYGSRGIGWLVENVPRLWK